MEYEKFWISWLYRGESHYGWLTLTLLLLMDLLVISLWKTAEGTANFITKYLKENLSKGLLNKLSILFSYNVLKKFKEQLDPRKYNGAILLGLSGPVVKSHGSTDSKGLANSIKMCNKIVKGKLIEKIKKYLSH